MNPGNHLGALLALLLLPYSLPAQSSTLSQGAAADTFVSSGQPDTSFGTMGAMEIAAPTTAQPRTQQTLLLFDTSALRAGFDATFGPGNWAVSSVSLTVFSSVATAGQQPNNTSFNKIAAGNFELDLLSNNNWNETSITWNTMSSILPGAGNSNTLTPLGTYFWPATGSASSTWALNAAPALLDAINNGNSITVFGQPTADSTVGYLWNTRLTNPAQLNVTAQAVPEPAAAALVLGFLVVLRESKRHGPRPLKSA